MRRKPTIAICYDFDGTLSPGNMQEYGFFDGLEPKERKTFWAESKQMAKEHQADGILMYMRLMLRKADQDKRLKTTKSAFKAYGKSIELYPGVETWFSRINEYGKKCGVKIEHYIVSSGLKEMIEGTKIAHYFTGIYACSFLYDNNDVAVWPAQAINYTTKTQFLFRINKGIKDLSDDTSINQYVAPEERPVPFSRIIYIGDGETDIPCMKLVKEQGGYSIAVFNPKKAQKKKVSERLKREHRVNFCIPADYSTDSKIEEIIKRIIDKMASECRLHVASKSSHRKCSAPTKIDPSAVSVPSINNSNIETERKVEDNLPLTR